MTHIPLASSTVHTFRKSLKVGQEAEEKLYSLLGGTLEKADMPLQRLGIDAILTSVSGHRYSIEIKTDARASQTGNAFIEVQSSSDRLGWVYTSCAQVLLYYIPDLAEILLIPMLDLKRKLHAFKVYPKGHAQNKGYASTGLLVPLSVLRSMHVPNEDIRLHV